MICRNCGYDNQFTWFTKLVGNPQNCSNCGMILNPARPTQVIHKCPTCSAQVNQPGQTCNLCLQRQQYQANQYQQQVNLISIPCSICGRPMNAPSNLQNNICQFCYHRMSSVPIASAMIFSNVINPGQPLNAQLYQKYINQLNQQVSDDPYVEKEPDEWEQLIERARELKLTQEDIELALALKASGLTRADIAIMEALKEKLHG